MQRRPPTDISDYLEIILRRRWWVIVPAVVITCAMVMITIRLPKSYRSETMIQVNPQKVPENYVKSTVSTDITDRLQTISQEILSRTRLQKIIDQFGLYRDHPAGMSQEDIIEMMRKDIAVKVEEDGNGRQKASAAFKIAYVGKDPAVVQQVTRQIASLFIEENLKVREQQAEGTSEFIEGELTKSRDALKVQEDRIKAFKARNMGNLPEQQQANLAVLGQMQALLQANSDAIGRAQQQKSYLESVLEAMGNKQAPATKSGFQAELDARRAELVSAEEKYTPDHPDVKRLRNEVKALEAKAASMATSEPQNANEPGNIKAQLSALQQELKDRNRRQSDIEARIRSVQSRIEVLPNVEQQFAEINRDYQTSQANYQSLLEKKNSSSMAAELERHAKGEQFRILDPASFPEKPFKPDLVLLSALGLLGGLALGGGLGLLMEFRDPSLHSEKDLGFLLSARVFGTIPVILTPTTYADEKRKLRWEWVAGSVCALSLLGALAMLYRHSSGLFRGHM